MRPLTRQRTVAPASSISDLPTGLAQASLGFLLAGLGPYVLLLAAELHRTRQEIAWLSSTFGAGLVVVAVAALLLRQARAAIVLRAAAIAAAAGATSAALAPSMFGAAVGALLIGIGGAGIVLATPALLRGPTAAARLTRVIAASSCASITAPLLVAAVQNIGLPGRLALLAPLPALIAVATYRCAEPPQTDPGEDGRRPPLRQLAIGWLCIVLAVASEFCFTIWGAARLRDTGTSPATAAALSAAFLIGMAAGRLAAPRIAARPSTVPIACLTAIAGTGVVCVGPAPWPVVTGLAVAGLGIAVLYPISLARLTATPGLSASRSAALGALASGTAIITAPSLLATVGSAVSLRVGFLFPGVLLVMLLVLSRTYRSSH